MTENAQGNTPHVYQAIAGVMSEIAKQGISKDRKNDQQGYKFRGIDDVYNAMAPILASNQLCILPFVKSREVVERQTRNGGALFYVTVAVDYTLVSALDGSTHVISAMGEAMDSGDKATNKAMSAAYKYACMQAFCIPTEGDNDADRTTHEGVMPRSQPALTSNEIATITNLAKSAGVELSAIATAYGVGDITQVPLSATADIVAKLQNRIAANSQPKAA